METELKIWRSLQLVDMVNYFESILTDWLLVKQVPHKWDKYPHTRGSKELPLTLHKQEHKKVSCKNQKVALLQKSNLLMDYYLLFYFCFLYTY